MELVASSESHIHAGERFGSYSIALENRVIDLVATSSLHEFDAKVRYVPIIMPPERTEAYPARSRLEKSKRIVDVCPQLNFHIFRDRSDDALKMEWLRGLESVADGLGRLGASQEMIEEWNEILNALK